MKTPLLTLMFTQKICLLLVLSGIVRAIFWDKFNYNSGNVVRVCLLSQIANFQSTCVLCNSNLYANTMLSCTQSTGLPANTTQAQALCIINLCRNQVNQNQGYWRRRKRQTQIQTQNYVLDKFEEIRFQTNIVENESNP